MQSKTTIAIFQQYESQIRAFVQSRIGRTAAVSDLLQEIWYQLSKQQDPAQIKNPKAWLYQVARSKIIDHYRRKMPDWLEDYLEEEEGYDRVDFLTDFDTPEEVYWREEFWDTFYEALHQLPEAQRYVFVQNELADKTLREIAEQTNTNLKTIISRKGYAVKRLREELQELFDNYFDYESE
ncbi:MAG: sigma-70 family RNA polymerase sigma factor [Bacteroidota bacterium]